MAAFRGFICQVGAVIVITAPSRAVGEAWRRGAELRGPALHRSQTMWQLLLLSLVFVDLLLVQPALMFNQASGGACQP